MKYIEDIQVLLRDSDRNGRYYMIAFELKSELVLVYGLYEYAVYDSYDKKLMEFSYPPNLAIKPKDNEYKFTDIEGCVCFIKDCTEDGKFINKIKSDNIEHEKLQQMIDREIIDILI